jgi:branched-chain amino acid transport system substrate-binding protein
MMSSLLSRRPSRRRILKVGGVVLAGATVPLGLLGRSESIAAEPVKVGAIGSLTGVVSVWGKVLKEGAELAVEHLNADGGILGRPVQLVLEDDESKPDVGARKARKLALEDNVDVIVGINHSGVLLSVLEQLPQIEKILIGSCATTSEATTQRFNRYLFRVHANSDQEGMSGALYAKDLPYRRWSVIAPNYAYGFETWGSFISNLKRLKPDIEILDVQAWPAFGAPDYTSHLARLQAAKPDAVVSAMWGGDAVNLLRQARRFGTFDQIAFFSPAVGALDVLYALGDEFPLGLYTDAHAYWFGAPTTDRAAANNSFVETYRKKFGTFPHSSAHGTYAAIKTFKRAAEKAQSVKTADLIAALEGIEVDAPGFSGTIRKEDHQVVHDIAWGRTVALNEGGLKRGIGEVRWTAGNLVTPPIDEVLQLRQKGGKASYYQYVKNT